MLLFPGAKLAMQEPGGIKAGLLAYHYKQVFLIVCFPAHTRQIPCIDLLCRLCYVVSAPRVNPDSTHCLEGSFIQHCRWSLCCYCFCFSTFWHVIAAENMHLEWSTRTHTPPERQTIRTFCTDGILASLNLFLILFPDFCQSLSGPRADSVKRTQYCSL